MPDNIRVIIVDDEALARYRVKELLEVKEDFDIIGECASGKDAIKMIVDKKPDLLFLDITLTDMEGFDVLEAIEDQNLNFNTVFVTARDDAALQAFEHFAIDYILKPFKDSRFYQTLDRVKQRILVDKDNSKNELKALINALKEQKQDSISDAFITVKSNNKMTLIRKDEIEYILASGYYLEIYEKQQRHLIRESMGDILDRLDTSRFIRIHRSTIINLEFLKEIVKTGANDYSAVLRDNSSFKISKSFKDQLFSKFK